MEHVRYGWCGVKTPGYGYLCPGPGEYLRREGRTFRQTAGAARRPVEKWTAAAEKSAHPCRF